MFGRLSSLTERTGLNTRPERQWQAHDRYLTMEDSIPEGTQTDMQNVTTEVDKIKIKFEVWHCDKDVNGFMEFMESTEAVVRSVKYGNEIEDYLDKKLDRLMYQATLISAIIEEDPDFAEPADVDATGDPTDPTTAQVTRKLFSSPGTIRSVESLRAASQRTDTLPSAGSYFNLSPGALALDRMLYSVLRTLVIGSKAVLIRCIKRQSYIQGMCLLHRHCDITRNDRIAKAFDDVDKLSFKGDAQEWATTAISSVRELYASKASIAHYCLTRLMHNFAGKVKTVQYRIAEDLQALKPGDEVNIYDLIQTYASMIASVGDSTGKIMNVNEDHKDHTCFNCGEKGHHKKDCPKLEFGNGYEESSSLPPQRGRGRGKGGGRNRSTCTFCGWRGHTEHECHKKKQMQKQVMQVMSMGAPAEDQGASHEGNTTASWEQTETPQASLAAYLTQLKQGKGGNRQSLITTVPSRSKVDTAFGHRGDAHLGEASHPGPVYRETRTRFTIAQFITIAVACAISVCDGMGCGLISLRDCDSDINRYIAVEIDEDAKCIAKNASPHKDGKMNLDHTWHSNLYNITEDDIIALGKCQDVFGRTTMSRLQQVETTG